ncbi:efflux transporter outer membrane subunit [Lacinutrix sp. C3R15]|uniref:efflux transporter outer membrane subunit n=1 Tax=Flavobacteriaceae TaxID=49546 RepID=UPI001C0906CA|nr:MULTISPECIES: efflux transporter outer membrane subunit [Flavobacteriaceae]MBU2940953.1 efflux transporter outer membrane subunit [Lacinutrix sp. C3R15]MDO6624272.1 efflux transporter outer membrane subunit [Oceanihabitans sp. 1_MG-2023]
MKTIIRHKNFSKGALLLLVAFTLQSCFVAEDYVRPDVTTETEALYRTENLPTDSLSIADVSWKNLFTDQYLQQYIEEGLQNNMDVRIALQQIIAAQAYAKQGKAGYLPTLSVGPNYTRQEFSENSQFGSIFSEGTDTYDITANLSWEADIWGKIRSNKRATQAAYLQSVAGHQAVKTQLISSIANTYYNLLALDAQLEVTKQTIATRESGVATIKALKDAGQVTQVAVDQNIAQYNSAKALQVDIETAIFKTENTLSILLGKQPQRFERSSLDLQKIEQDIKLGVPATLLSNRPDVMAAEYALIQDFELTNVAKSSLYPSLTLTASTGLQSLELDKLLNVNSLFATVVGGLTQPLLNQRKLKTQKEVALANQESSLLNFKKTLLVAGTEVSNALFSLQAETKKFQFRKNEVEALRTAEANSEELLKNGYANYLDLLTARQSALSAELNIIDSQLQQLISIVDLYEALGGGWK